MNECKIIADLLPTYCDGLTGLETNAYIEEHLQSCLECRKLLERMQEKRVQQKDADIRRAQFKAAVALYERKHQMRVGLIIFVCILLFLGFFVFRACSFDLAIKASGLNKAQLQVVQEPITDANGQKFQIVFSVTEDGYGALAYLTQNALGFWTLDAVDVATPEKQYGIAQFAWFEPIFSLYGGEPRITTGVHIIYAGCNAIGSLELIPQEQIPGNVTVLATQNSENYYIHMIQALPDGGSAFDILPILKENNLIS